MDALNANGKTKQVRKPNYTHEEITVILEEVAANKVIIQSTLNRQRGDQPTKGPVVAGYRKKRKQLRCVRSNTRPSS